MRRDYRGDHDRLKTARRKRARRRRGRKSQPMEAYIPYRRYGAKYAVITRWKRRHPRKPGWAWSGKLQAPAKKLKHVIFWQRGNRRDEDDERE